MSSADETGDAAREAADPPTVTTTPVGNAAGSSQWTPRGEASEEEKADSEQARPVGHEASGTAPWQRATSTVRGAPPAAGQDVRGGGYTTYASDGYGSTDERQAAQGHPEQQEAQQRPLVTGTAAASVLGGQSGRQDPQQGKGGRAAVNLGTVTGRSTEDQQYGPSDSGRGPTPSALRRPGRGPRRASLQLKRFDPWSVLKLALVLCVAMFFVWMVAVGVLYGALDGMGVWDKINGTYNSLTAPKGSSGGSLISAGSVFGVAAIIGAINIILFTALATIGSFVYNVSADLVGGLEVTLAERE